ncbi:hypothetical protein F2P81_020023 [Scophthalmus maximus]|uniref:Uncharacterized protein n=1 Tax=Scophthalmus maximus TaxID=52904 RepID=A0A6A4S7V5_SCOMX|nr:hypothetical protein F2P81_020023 [Scophthalmus maximus]
MSPSASLPWTRRQSSPPPPNKRKEKLTQPLGETSRCDTCEEQSLQKRRSDETVPFFVCSFSCEVRTHIVITEQIHQMSGCPSTCLLNTDWTTVE